MAQPPDKHNRFISTLVSTDDEGGGGGRADRLRSFHLTKRGEKWSLEKAGTDRAVKTFDRKADALKRNVLRNAIGRAGGSVRIHKTDGRIQEERTYPRGKDPRGRKG